ncbi:MAG TPA: methyltransferase domain-containing protein [Verrucomicrobiales bacterium]|nr:methyltransferase domain-containing protein [Verrucomicrobiales bacterium]HIL24227.1 methyltransferase domain-containing protein [Verrucomicrobiota bacterium]
MMDACNICDEPLGAPVYESARPVSITSLCQVLDGPTRVWHCENCGHTQTAPLPALEKFYAEDYHILTASEDEDQLYAVREGRKIFRTEHQITTLLAKLDLSTNAQVLDYGCGKAATLKVLHGRRDDLAPYVFDVGEQYRDFWNAFVPTDNQAVNEVPTEWAGRFDAVISFFALEHVVAPKAFVAEAHRLLRDGGTFYFLVPNVFANTADLVVADHVNHFSESSLHRLLTDAGFAVREIDDTAHNSAWVVVAEKSDANGTPPVINSVADEVTAMAEYWREFGNRVRAFENTNEGEAAIYGSGFYGTFIHACLERPEAVACFLDQNPHRQKQTLLEKPILAPEALPETVRRLYVGLNPRVAREAMAALKWPQELEVFFP